MKKVVCMLSAVIVMFGSSAMAKDTKAADAVVAVASATPAVESVPAIQGMDADLVKGAVLTFIEKDSALKGGAFLFNDVDKKKSKVLALKNPVIKDAPIVQAVDVSVLPVEMIPLKGEKTVYTVDFQVKKGATGALDVASIVVRKVGKKERFIYDASGQMAPVPKKTKKSRK